MSRKALKRLRDKLSMSFGDDQARASAAAIEVLDAFLEPEELAVDGTIGEESVSDLVLTWYRENGFARVVSPQGALDRLVTLVEAIEARGARRGAEGPVHGQEGTVAWTLAGRNVNGGVWDPRRPHKARVAKLLDGYENYLSAMEDHGEGLYIELEAEILAAEARGRDHAYDAVEASQGRIVGASGASVPLPADAGDAIERSAREFTLATLGHVSTVPPSSSDARRTVTETREEFDPVAIHDRITEMADDRLGLQVPGTTAMAMLDALDARHSEVRLELVKAERLAEEIANGLAGVLTAIEAANASGVIDTRDFASAQVVWYQPIDRAREALNKWEASNV